MDWKTGRTAAPNLTAGRSGSHERQSGPSRAAAILGDIVLAIGLVMAAPFAMMAIGIPVALLARGLLAITGYL